MSVPRYPRLPGVSFRGLWPGGGGVPVADPEFYLGGGGGLTIDW